MKIGYINKLCVTVIRCDKTCCFRNHVTKILFNKYNETSYNKIYVMDKMMFYS